MKNIVLLMVSLLVISCSHTGSKRTPTSGDPLGLGNEVFTVLGDNFYGGWTNKARATRIYVKRDPKVAGEYYFVFLEFNNLWHVAKEYGISLKLPGWAEKREKGFLKFINSQAAIYKMTPTDSSRVYELKPIKVTENGGVAPQSTATAHLKLWSGATEHFLEGAHIIALDPKTGEPYKKIPKGMARKTWFPPKNWSSSEPRNRRDSVVDTMSSAEEEKFPMPHIAPSTQYWMAKTTYKKAKLDSTWRNDQIAGPYLAAYNNVGDEVLHLRNLGENKDDLYALFVDPSEKVLSQREKDFTNKKSAHLNGAFKVKKADEGIFTMTNMTDQAEVSALGNKAGKSVAVASVNAASELNPRIGLFIDIFDNSAGGQDVVEVVYINPEDPADFMMYYEHPDNGEGE